MFQVQFCLLVQNVKVSARNNSMFWQILMKIITFQITKFQLLVEEIIPCRDLNPELPSPQSALYHLSYLTVC